MIAAASRGLLGRVGGDPRVERLALTDGGVERAHRLLERRLGVEAVRVEDVDVVEPHPLRATGRGSRAGTCASPTRRTGRATCRSRPWSRSPARRGTALKSSRRSAAEVLLRRPVRRPVVVREVEVRDARGRRRAGRSRGSSRAAGRRRSCARARARSPVAAGRCGRCGGTASGRSARLRRRTSLALVCYDAS